MSSKAVGNFSAMSHSPCAENLGFNQSRKFRNQPWRHPFLPQPRAHWLQEFPCHWFLSPPLASQVRARWLPLHGCCNGLHRLRLPLPVRGQGDRAHSQVSPRAQGQNTSDFLLWLEIGHERYGLGGSHGHGVQKPHS